MEKSRKQQGLVSALSPSPQRRPGGVDPDGLSPKRRLCRQPVVIDLTSGAHELIPHRPRPHPSRPFAGTHRPELSSISMARRGGWRVRMVRQANQFVKLQNNCFGQTPPTPAGWCWESSTEIPNLSISKCEASVYSSFWSEYFFGLARHGRRIHWNGPRS